MTPSDQAEKDKKKSKEPRPVTSAQTDYAITYAERLWRAAGLISAKLSESRDPTLIGPLAFNCAFAIEVAIKALHMAERKTAPARHHRLFDLFSDLEDESKEWITKRYNAWVAGDPLIKELAAADREQGHPYVSTNLLDILRAGNRAFEHWRYPFEELAPFRSESDFYGLALDHLFESLQARAVLIAHGVRRAWPLTGEFKPIPPERKGKKVR